MHVLLRALVATGLGAAALASKALMPPAGAETAAEAGARLIAAYPDHLARVEGNMLVWKDGTRMSIDDGRGVKSFEALLSAPDLDDIFAIVYPAGEVTAPPARDADPGRARPAAFFDKMYGDCRKGEVERNLTDVVWLPRRSGARLKVTRVNGVDRRLAAISRELDALPRELDVYLVPAAGTYNCRAIAGTDRTSTHGSGIAVDIALRRADYWRWSSPAADGSYVWRNRVPYEIVRIFESHGFIWGGKWYHYDSMHFEYRPELRPPERQPE